MGIYLGMLGISLFFAVYAQRAKPFPRIRSSYITFCVLAALPFIIITVFRYQVGTDWQGVYERHFLEMRNPNPLGYTPFVDAGFELLFRIFSLFTGDAWWPIAFVGLLTMIFFFKAFSQQSVMLPLSILFFFLCGIYFRSLEAIRQALAISIFLYSVKYLKARDWKRYFFLNLIGMTMHATSVIYLPIYFLYDLRATPRRCLILLGIAILGYPLLGILARVIAQIIPRFNRYLDTYFFSGNFSSRTFVTTLAFTLLQIFYLARYPQPDKDFEWMTYMMLIATVFLLYSRALPGAQRAAESASVIQVFSFPLMLKKEKDDRMRVLVAAGLIGLLSVRLFVFEIYMTLKYAPIPWYGVIPYKWVFFR